MKYLYLSAGLAALMLSGAPLGAQTITVSPSACQALTAHTAADDVAYKPGVDVAGNDVAPADLSMPPGNLILTKTTNFGCPSKFPSKT